jgi:hypothetical protein
MAKYEDFLDLLSEKEAASYLRLSNPRTLAVWRSTKRYGLPFVKLGRSVFYRKRDLASFVAARFVEPAPSLRAESAEVNRSSR